MFKSLCFVVATIRVSDRGFLYDEVCYFIRVYEL